MTRFIGAYQEQRGLDLDDGALDDLDDARAAAARCAGYEKLNLWFTDWAETLRSELG